MSDEFLDTWGPLVRKIVTYTCRDFPDLDKEDLTQELYAAILSQDIDPKAKWASRALGRCARMFAWEQRKEHLQLSSQYSYRTSDIKRILEFVFDAQDWSSTPVPDDAKSEYNDVFLEINCDIKRAWEGLGHAQKKVIFEKYALGISPKTDAEIKRLWRAIATLTDKVNFYQKPRGVDYVGTRKVITNANARANISNLED